MANIFGGTEPPAWLSEIARPIDGARTGQFLGTLLAGATNAFEKDDQGKRIGLAQGYRQAVRSQQHLADPTLAVKMKTAEANALSQRVNALANWQKADLLATERAAWLDDAPAVQAFAKLPLDQRATANLPGVKSQKANELVMMMQRGASASVVGKGMNESKVQYDNRVKALNTANPRLASGLALNATQFPDEQKWAMLEEAEIQARSDAQAAAAGIRAERIAAGDTVVTKLGPKPGDVTETLRPPTMSESERDVMPEIVTLEKGNIKINILRNPKTGRFQVLDDKGGRKDLTPSQLQEIAKEMRTGYGPEGKKSAATIQQWLSQTALEQVGGSGNFKPGVPKATGTNAPGSGITWEKFEKSRGK